MTSQWTIGQKIKCGFVVVVVLLVAMLGLGVHSLRNTSTGFNEYSEFARHTNLAGRIQANLLSARTEVKEFVLNPNATTQQNFRTRWARMKEFIAEGRSEINEPGLHEVVLEIEANAVKYEQLFNELSSQIELEERTLHETLDAQGPRTVKLLNAIMESAASDNDMKITLEASAALRDLLLARTNVNRYLRTVLESDADAATHALEGSRVDLEKLGASIQNSDRRKLCAEATESLQAYAAGWKIVHESHKVRAEILKDGLNKIGPAIAKAAEEMKLSIMKEQDILGPRLIAANESATRFILIIGACAVAAAVAFSLLLTRSVNSSLESIASKLGVSSENVSSAATQVSGASQELAGGASEQASSLEETSASLEELSSMTQQNADNAREAKSMAEGVRASAERGRTEMNEMALSIGRMKQSADETARILKTIDEIAFQTNLLALNAAVEAARAGDAGKGFAVVAEEVRNLARRSAEAAKSTATLINDSQKNAENGVQVSNRVSTTFDQIIHEIRSMSGRVSEVSSASEEQSRGIEQINTAVSQMDKITQSCAANAEECAASSKELNSQATEMHEMVAALEAMIRGQYRGQGPQTPAYPHASRIELPAMKASLARQATAGRALTKSAPGSGAQKALELDASDF